MYVVRFHPQSSSSTLTQVCLLFHSFLVLHYTHHLIDAILLSEYQCAGPFYSVFRMGNSFRMELGKDASLCRTSLIGSLLVVMILLPFRGGYFSLRLHVENNPTISMIGFGAIK
jgi:hypothetical protein